MKWTKYACLAAIVFTFAMGTAFAGSDPLYREQSDAAKMMHKLGRGVTNVLTCWVEVPRNIAIEWERTDPVTGFIMGTVQGVGWGFARFATGVYDTVTFPFPVPPGYVSMLDPEFVITDIWGDPIPGLTDIYANDPDHPKGTPIYPQQFGF
ncbi:MAG: exosortase system-associated protein, TIGR04073 family [bacterium]|nr:exosortase system-associated protein, TIGR04073 family [bacterium]